MSEFFGFFLPISIPVLAVGGITFIVIAIVQEAKMGGRAEAIRSAFSYIVALAMLFTVVGSTAFLLQQVSRVAVFRQAQRTNTYVQPPPTLYLTSSDKGSALYACTDNCQFNATDREQFNSWKEQYQQWKKTSSGTSPRYTIDDKRQTVNAISFLLVSLPLFWWFFVRMVNRDQKKSAAAGQHKPTPLRSSYFYLVAFVGLVGLVVSGAMLINIVLKSALGLQSDTANGPKLAEPTMVGVTLLEKNGVKSVVSCADKCGFTVEDKQLAEQWQVDYEAWQKTNNTSYPRQNNTQTDLANILPILLVAFPLFFYHFLTIRRETKDDLTPPKPTMVA